MQLKTIDSPEEILWTMWFDRPIGGLCYDKKILYFELYTGTLYHLYSVSRQEVDEIFLKHKLSQIHRKENGLAYDTYNYPTLLLSHSVKWYRYIRQRSYSKGKTPIAIWDRSGYLQEF